MLRFFAALLLLINITFIAGCGAQQQTNTVKTLVVYSELDNKFSEDIAVAYAAHNKNGITVKVIYELKDGAPLPDLVLAGHRTLNGLKIDNLLHPVSCIAGDRLASAFKDADGYWYGAFYDPVVFLVNQQYARRVGQQSILGWKDLENTDDIRITVQNLSNSGNTTNFLGAMASQMGESTSLNYLWNINRWIVQYAKFPFTPIRMAAVGDADLAITRQSYVFKYLENNFPAYVVYPVEGTPVNLYGAAVFKGSQYKKQGEAFIEWLLADDAVKRISQTDETGFMFLLPQGLGGAAANSALIWTNKDYLTAEKQNALTSKWLENVRFSNDK